MNSIEVSLNSTSHTVAARGAWSRHFEQGLYSYQAGRYAQALKEFEKAAAAASSASDPGKVIESYSYILRILAEREDFAKIEKIESTVIELLKRNSVEAKIRARALYVIGICSCNDETKRDEAINRFREAIDAAKASHDQEALAGPLYGSATVLFARQQYAAALRELENLDELLTHFSNPEMASASHLLRAYIFKDQERLEDAMESAWSAYEMLKDNPQLILFVRTLVLLGDLYTLKGDANCARLYLDLAQRSLKRSEFPRIANLLDEKLARARALEARNVDLIYDSKTGVLIERKQGEIRFERQFVLRDLFLVFLQAIGRTLSKEDLASKVWHETYDADVHDNKIYVTIKRLQQLLESDQNHTEYILRGKDGYLLNPKLRIQVDGVTLKR